MDTRVLSLERVLAKTIHCVVLVWAVVCWGSAQALRGVYTAPEWALIFGTPTVAAESVVVGLLWYTRGAGSKNSRREEWLRALVLAAIPAACLLSLLAFIWFNFRIES